MNKLAGFGAGLAVCLGLSIGATQAAEVTILAVEGAGGPEVTETISWTVVRVDSETGKPETKPTATGKSAQLKTKLEPGQYIVTAMLGKTQARQAILVGEAATTRSIILTDPSQKTAKALAGPPAQLSINMKLSKGKNPVKDPVHWEVYEYTKGATESGALVMEQKAATGKFTLPPGSYVVRANFQGAQADLVIPLEAGNSFKYTLNLYAGYAKLSAVKPTKLKATDKVTWQILRQRPNAPGVYEMVASSDKPDPTIMLREGRYLAVARVGPQLWGSEQITILAGETIKKKVNLKEGVGAPEVAAAN
ncbi:MAG: hypothetical protein JNL25_00630 [Rhodospirillaceae bacterium]|nr:hypothetical protein [Rhodospirillaceae bacterium]